MAIRDVVVQKYGGSSVADAERLRNVARRVAERARAGVPIVVVVSAMGKTTDALLDLARGIDPEPAAREVDVLLATGQMQSSALLAIALRTFGVEAVSLTGFQAGIRTESRHGKARIVDIDTERVLRELENGRVVIVAGFQGYTEDFDITTIGRGGSDTTAVALAAALDAARCEIYTDVRGVYTSDPRIVPAARQLATISYEEMLELASVGAKVMASRAVEIGSIYGIPILVASSMEDAPGTLIQAEGGMETQNKVAGIATDKNVAKVTLVGVPDRPGIASQLFTPLAEAGISVDTIVQNTGQNGKTDLSFTVARVDLLAAERMARSIAGEMGAEGATGTDGLAKVSIVGSGMQSAPGFAARMFRTLFEAGINIEMITTSEIRITCIVDASSADVAANALHAAFALDRAD